MPFKLLKYFFLILCSKNATWCSLAGFHDVMSLLDSLKLGIFSSTAVLGLVLKRQSFNDWKGRQRFM